MIHPYLKMFLVEILIVTLFFENEIKALGVAYKQNSDLFTFKVKIDQPKKLT